MVKKLVCLLCICWAISGMSIQAQSKLKVGLDMGYTYSNLKANLSNLIESKYRGGYGFGVNVSGEYTFWKSLFLTSGVSYLQKKYTFKRTGIYSGWYTKYHNDFLSVPLMVGGYIVEVPNGKKGLWIKVAGGMYGSYWMRMKRCERYPALSEVSATDYGTVYRLVSDTYDFKKNENMLNRFGYGMQGQLGLGYSFSKFSVYGTYNQQYGLSDISKSNQNQNLKKTIRSYMISVGTSYRFD